MDSLKEKRDKLRAAHLFSDSIYTDESSRVANQTIEEWHADYDAVWSAQCEDLF